MTDTVFVTGLALHAYHGVMQHEAKVGQTFKLDLVLDIDLAAGLALRQARRTPSATTRWSTWRAEAFCARRYRLVEAAAGAVADAVLDALPAGLGGARHRPQAACADRRDLRRRRRASIARTPPG